MAGMYVNAVQTGILSHVPECSHCIGFPYTFLHSAHQMTSDVLLQLIMTRPSYNL